jgi:N-methylhydantoinase A
MYGKSLTDYGDLINGVLRGLETTEANLEETVLFKHGTTHVINTLIQRSGAKTALVTTKGFADSLEIGRGNRPVPFALGYRRDQPLVDRTQRFELHERMNSGGEVLIPLDLDELKALAAQLKADGYEAVAVSFIRCIGID